MYLYITFCFCPEERRQYGRSPGFPGCGSRYKYYSRPYFILAFHLGVAGAALATIAAQALSAGCISGYTFVKAKHLCPSKRHMRFDKRLLKLIAGNSVLTSIQQSIMNFGILMVQGLVNSFGFAASAAFAAVVKIDAFAYMPARISEMLFQPSSLKIMVQNSRSAFIRERCRQLKYRAPFAYSPLFVSAFSQSR